PEPSLLSSQQCTTSALEPSGEFWARDRREVQSLMLTGINCSYPVCCHLARVRGLCCPRGCLVPS
ncbi:hypothetical protein LEMLEM_LOCUS2867, partial [Lemmus lemmus]